jgi:hypothetical protein
MALSAAPAAGATDLETLLKSVAVRGAQEVAYEEHRYFGALTEPLVSRGHLRYEPPGRLIKNVESPRRETAVVDEDRLTVLDASGVETASIDLWQNRDLRLVFEGLRGVLGGNSAALRAAFDPTLEDLGSGWRLHLVPKGDAGDARIKGIVVSGAAKRIDSFEIQESDGDRSLIQLLAAPPPS